MSEKPKLCEVCKANLWKYRCSKCRTVTYCSVDCFKKHQLECSALSTAPPASSSSSSVPSSDAASRAKSATSEASLPGTVPLSVLEGLRNHEHIVRALANKELQEIIRTIDAGPDRELLLQQNIASNEHFRQFVNELAEIVAADLHEPPPTDPLETVLSSLANDD